MTEPSELSHRITLLKGDHTTAEIVAGANVSRETFRKIERGQSVKLDTLLDIARFLKATESQTTELVAAWAKMEIGEHAHNIRIAPTKGQALRDAPDEIQTLLQQLSPYDRQQIILAMTRPEVRRAIPALNQLHDSKSRVLPPAKTTYRKK